MEKAVQKLEGQLRTLKLASGNHIDQTASVRSRTFAWLALRAATSINKYHTGTDYITAMQRITGTGCKRQAVEFGEQVHSRQTVKHHSTKAEAPWREGTFLGVQERTRDIYIATATSTVQTCRTMRSTIADK